MGRPCTKFAEKLASIGLNQYYDLLTSEGFGTWESVLDVTEDDMERLGFKRGHRRKLLRAIATDRGYPISEPLANASISKSCLIVNPPPKDQTMSSCQKQRTKLLYQQFREIETFVLKLPQAEHTISSNYSNPGIDFEAYQIDLAGFHGEQVKKIVEASKSGIPRVICDNRLLANTGRSTSPENLRSMEMIENTRLSVPLRKEILQNDFDQQLWEFINF